MHPIESDDIDEVDVRSEHPVVQEPITPVIQAMQLLQIVETFLLSTLAARIFEQLPQLSPLLQPELQVPTSGSDAARENKQTRSWDPDVQDHNLWQKYSNE